MGALGRPSEIQRVPFEHGPFNVKRSQRRVLIWHNDSGSLPLTSQHPSGRTLTGAYSTNIRFGA
jgi:hypothetical protein